MIESNFMLYDILGALIGVILFPLVIVIPGYIIGWIFNLFEFRAHNFFTRCAAALLLSIISSPIFYFLVTSIFSMKVAIFLTLGLAVIFILIVLYDRNIFHLDQNWKLFFGVATTWAVFIIFSLIQIKWGNQLFISVVSFDQSGRVSIINAITRTGVPPVNPSYYPGKAVSLTFLYYFWYILCSLVDILGFQMVDARAALNASSVWAGLGLIAAIAFYLRLRNADSRRSIKTGIGLLVVSGLDVIPITMLMLAVGQIVGSVDVWNTWIVSWVGSVLWVPHHVAALIAGMTAVMLAQLARRESPMRQYLLLFFAGAGFASAFGLSVWVTFVYSTFWIVWMIVLYLKKVERKFILSMLFAGITALALSSSFLFELIQVEANSTGNFPVIFEIRSLLQLESFIKGLPIFWRSMIMLLTLPVNYLLELGFFFLGGIYWFVIKSRRTISSNHFYTAEVILLLVVLVISSCLRSTLGSNDLGWRSWLPGQFVLLIWGTDVLRELAMSHKLSTASNQQVKIRSLLLVFAVIGVLTSVVDAVLLRIAWPLMTDRETSERYYSAHLAYDYLRDLVPGEAIIQNNPFHYIDRPSGLYATHQMVISSRTPYGLFTAGEFDYLANEVGDLFISGKTDWYDKDLICKEHSIDVLIFDDTDSIWKNLAALKNERNPLYENRHYVIFSCGGG